jgi:hypothetical protein
MLAATASVAQTAPRVRWSYLWSRRSDLTFNLIPFWIGMVLVVLLYAARDLAKPDNPVYNFTVFGVQLHLATWVLYLYGPLVDAPHLWATIARTYTDRDEWKQRRTLFLGSLAALLLGPAVILLPYALRALSLLSAGQEQVGWLLWTNFFTFYALFHINKQHWGFVALYRRKNQDSDPLDFRVDQAFFYVAIWAPFVAMVTAPWYTDYDGKPFAFTHGAGSFLYLTCHVIFFVASIAYVAFQVLQYQRGVARNGPKLLYLATILPLNYLAFAIHPFVAAFWIVTTGLGHCAQYHRVVWGYGQAQYVGKQAERKLPTAIFENLPLYLALGVLFGVVTLQSFGGGTAGHFIAGGLGRTVFSSVFTFLDEHAGVELAAKVTAAFVSGVRLHHFYVDSKIWRVSKSAALAKNLNVSAATS